VDEDSEQPVDPADGVKAVEGAADGAADGAQDDGQDQGHEYAQDGVEMEDLLHLGRVRVVEPEDDQQRAEEKDLGHQRLDHSALVAEE
jgi:hypothetical protein